MFAAKLKAWQRVLMLQRQVESKNAKLLDYVQEAEEEADIARHLMTRMVRTEMLRDPMLQYWIEPAKGFSGDVIACARTPGNALHVLLDEYRRRHPVDGDLLRDSVVARLARDYLDMQRKGARIGGIPVSRTKLGGVLRRLVESGLESRA